MASRYFVGAGNWDASDTTVWSETSGGTTGASVPTSADDVFFDANSGACEITDSAVCADLDFTGYTDTLSGNDALTIHGSLTLAAGMTRTYTGAITFAATATGKTLTFNGITTASSVTFDGVGGGWTLQDAWNNGTSNITLTRGSLDTNSQTVTGRFASSNSNTRSLSLGASTINVNAWNINDSTNLTFDSGTSTVSLTGTIGGGVMLGGGLTYNVVTLASTYTGSQLIIGGANTFATLTITGHSIKTQTWFLSANQTVTGTLTIAGNSLTNRLLIQSSTLGTARTITAATTTLSNCDFQDITGAGAGSWSGTSIGNALGNTGITFTTPVTRYAVVAGNWSDTATWSTSSGGAGGASVPLCHDTVILDASSAAGTYTMDMPRAGADITCTGFTRTLSKSITLSIFGSLTLASGMTLSDLNDWYLWGRSSHTITTATKIPYSIRVSSYGGTYTLQDALTLSDKLYLNNGTFDANDYNITTLTFSSSNTANRTLFMGSGTWTLSGTGTVWNCATVGSFTLNCETSTIVLSNATTSAKTFAGGGKTYYNLTISGAGVANYTFTGSNTFNKIESTKTVAHGLVFTAGTTQTVADFVVAGTSGNVVTINSTTTGTHTLTKTGGGRITSDYLNIQHSIATPSNTWYAGLNSTNNQADATAGSGWLFTVPIPTVTTQAASSVTDVTALGNGTVTDDGAGIVSRRGFVVSTSAQSDPGDTDPDVSTYSLVFDESGTFPEEAFSLSLTGLTESTTYYYRAFAENEGGFSYGAEDDFTTEATPLSPQVTTQAPSSITGTGATGNGTIVDENGSTVTERGMAVSTTSHSDPSNTNPDDSDYELVFSDTGTYAEEAFTKAITGLSNGTTYYVRAYAMNGVGFAYGDELSFITLGLPTVSIQTPSNRQSTTATLNGTITYDGEDTLVKRGFVYDTSTKSAPGNVAPGSSGYASSSGDTGTYTEGTFSKDITGLTQNQTYFVRAYTQNSIGYAYSDEIQFSTNTFPNTTSIVNSGTTSSALTNQQTTSRGIINEQTTSRSITNISL